MKLLPKEGKKKKEKNKNVKAEKRRFPLNSYNSLTGSSGSSRYPRLAGGCPAPPCLCTRLSERRFALKSQEFKARNTLGSLCQLGHPLGTAETQFPFFLRFIICCRKVAGGGGGFPHPAAPWCWRGPSQARSILRRRVAGQEQAGCTGPRSSHSPSLGTRSAWKYAARAWQHPGAISGGHPGQGRWGKAAWGCPRGQQKCRRAVVSHGGDWGLPWIQPPASSGRHHPSLPAA